MAAEKHNVKLPESVAENFKYVGNGHTKFIIPALNSLSVNVETLTPEQAELIVDHVAFIERKPKAKSNKEK